MAFGERLAQLRRENSLTQEQFAEALQVSRQAVSKWESGKGYPEIEKLLYICNRYKISLDDLFSEEIPRESSGIETEKRVPTKTFHNSFLAFFNNLSPKNKRVGFFSLLSVALVAGLLAVCLNGGFNNMDSIIWIAAIIIFGVVEALTAGLTSIWFVLGGVAGLIVAALGGPVWLQVVLFFLVSIVALVVTRPLVQKLSSRDNVPTNADRVIGEQARVTEKIDNLIPQGEVYVDGKKWSARSEDGSVIGIDQMVVITRMEGVKLFVKLVQ